MKDVDEYELFVFHPDDESKYPILMRIIFNEFDRGYELETI